MSLIFVMDIQLYRYLLITMKGAQARHHADAAINVNTINGVADGTVDVWCARLVYNVCY